MYLIYCCYHCITNSHNPTYLDCGNIISKSNDEVTIKRGIRTELYLNIEFEKSGFRSIKCNPTTYFSKQIGQTVCFNLNKDVSKWYVINNFVGYTVLSILCIIALSLFICFLIPDSFR